MNVLVVAGDTKGAWQMRGVQLGRAIGARVRSTPSAAEWAWADLVVLVKRAAPRWAEQARRLSVPVVWDVLDCWAQPEQNADAREFHVEHVRRIAAAAGVTVLIGATRLMAEDIGGRYLPHHSRLGLTPIPVRARAEVVGYDGNKKYLGRWRAWLETACASLGLRFVVNPANLGAVDVLVSFRDGPWDGWVCRHWKSGVKHVNAIAAGRPILCQPSSALAELGPIGAAIDTREALGEALASLARSESRDAAYELGRARCQEFQLQTVAGRYTDLLRQIATRAAA